MACPVVLQAAQTECGLSVSASLLQHYGRYQTVSDLRIHHEPGREGLSLLQISDLLQTEGMQVRAFHAGTMKDLKAFKEPVIMHWQQSHYVVLDGFRHGQVKIIDPASGVRWLSIEEAESSFSGIALLATPGEDFAKKRRNIVADWQLKIFATSRLALPYLAFFTLLALTYGATFMVPFAVQGSIDAHLSGDQGSFTAVFAMVLTAVALYYLVGIARVTVLASIVSDVGLRLLGNLFNRLLKLPLTYFSLRAPGDVLYRLASANSLRDFLSSRLTELIMNSGTALVVLTYIFLQSKIVFLIALALLAVVVLVWLVTMPAVARHLDAEFSHASDAQVVQLDSISTITSMKMSGSQESAFSMWKHRYQDSLWAMRRRMRVQQGVLGSAASAVQLAGPLLLLLIALTLVDSGVLSLGQAVAMQGISAILFSSASATIFGVMEVSAVDRAVARMVDIQRYDPETDEGTRTYVPDGSLAVKDLSFAYPGARSEVLSGINFSVPSGGEIAVVGSSGSGKSTLGLLLCSLYRPAGGQIRIGGHRSQDYTLNAIRSEIGYVPQQLELKTGSLYDNLTAGLDTSHSRAAVLDEIRGMGIIDFVDDLPLGYDTVLSSGGANFSGGQKQRIAIVSALLRRPKVLVLDEATSALDTVTERRVTQLIARYRCTKVVIAHRLSTVRDADQIIVLDGGSVVQSGDHHELLALPGHYRDLYSAEEESQVQNI